MLAILLAATLGVGYYHRLVVDPTKLAHRFDGIGTMDNGANSKLLYDYGEPQRTEVLDYLFKPGVGAQLHVLKVSLGGDSRVSPGGSEAAFAHTRAEFTTGGVWSRGYTFWLMKEARKRNPSILLYALSYSRPSWIGGGFFFSLDSIDYNIRWLEHAKAIGCRIDFMGMYVKQTHTTNQLHTAPACFPPSLVFWYAIGSVLICCYFCVHALLAF
jgi:hypothetical protein